MSLSAIRDQIKAILESVEGIGVVHDYERWAVDWNKILELFKPARQDKINGWMITRRSTDERVEVFGRNLVSHTFLIRGVYSLDDGASSEKTFQAIIEAIRTAFRSRFDLNGACEATYLDVDAMGPGGKVGVQVSLIETRMFGSILCHYCELLLGAQERVAY